MTRVDDRSMRAYLQLYLVLGSVNCRVDPVIVAEEAIRGGVTMIQFREKGRNSLPGSLKEKLARRLLAVCRSYGVPFIINDDIDLALTVDADGVHIGQEDEPAAQVRSRVGDKIVGVSAHTIDEARLAAFQEADYLGVGPVYPTVSKEDAREAQGTELIRDMRLMNVKLPIVGIGGITADRVKDVIRAGADGVAVISAITQTADIRDGAQRLASEVTSSSEFRRYFV